MISRLLSVVEGLGSGWRRKLVSPLRGQILEIGVGPGTNLSFYKAADSVDALEPDPGRVLAAGKVARRSEQKLGIPVRVQAASAENLPYPDASFDVVVSSLVFCSVKDPKRVLSEIRRVLKQDGELWMVEHVCPQGERAAWLAASATPLWKRIAHNCHLDRPTLELLDSEGWRFTLLKRRGVFVKLVAQPG